MPPSGPAVRRWYQPVRAWYDRGQDPWTAVALFAVGALIYLAGVRSLTGDDDATLAARLGVLAAGCAGLLLRRRMPSAALGIAVAVLVVDASWGVSLPVLLVLFDALFNATLYGSRRVSRALVGLVAVTAFGLAVTGLVVSRDWRTAFLFTLQAGLIPLTPVWWAMNVRRYREAAEAERIRAEQVATIAELDRRSAVAAERARLARDLHDVVAGHLSAIALQSEAVLSMADGDPATVRTVLRSVRENSVQSLIEMRAMIDLLRSEDGGYREPTTAPAQLGDLGPLLESARAGGLRVEEVEEFGAAPTGGASDPSESDGPSDGPSDDLPVAVDLAAYRIVQEALTNAVTHAPGARAAVRVARNDGRLIVEVVNELVNELADELTDELTDKRADKRADEQTDGGAARAAAARRGTGLASMRERAEAVGGSIAAGRTGRSWRVRAVLPIEGAGP